MQIHNRTLEVTLSRSPKDKFQNAALTAADALHRVMPEGGAKYALSIWLNLGFEMFTGRLDPLAVRPFVEDSNIQDQVAVSGWWMMMWRRGRFKQVRREVNPWTFDASYSNLREARQNNYVFVVEEITDKLLGEDHNLADPLVSIAAISNHAMMKQIETINPFEALRFFTDIVAKQDPSKEDPHTVADIDINQLEGLCALPYGPATTTHDDDDHRLVRMMFAVDPNRDPDDNILSWSKLGRFYPSKGLTPNTTFIIGKRRI